MGMDGYSTIFSSDLERTCFVCLFLEGKGSIGKLISRKCQESLGDSSARSG